VTALTMGALAGLGLLLICLGLTRPTAIPADPGRLPQLTAGVAVGLVAAVGVWLVCGWPVLTLAALAAGLLVPRWSAHRAETTALASRSEAIAEVGLGVTDALGGLACWGPVALRPALGQLAADAATLGLPQALDGFARRLADPLADVLAATLALNHRLGGRNLSQVLDDLAAAIHAEAHTLREVRARQAQQRLSARLVGAAPLVILLAIRQTNPAYLAPFDTPTGQAVLAAALLLIVVGYGAMVRLARPPAGTRLLPTTHPPAGGGRP
jgi:tight adherence protein B